MKNIKLVNKLIKECINEMQLKSVFKTLISEAIEEIKAEDTANSVHEMILEVEKEIQKENKEFCLKKDDYGDYVVEGCAPHVLRLKHLYEKKFQLTLYKHGTDRHLKSEATLDEVKTFIKEAFNKKSNSYTESAFNKCVENIKDKEGNKDVPVHKHVGEKAKDEVSKKEDHPDQPLKEVEKFKKQIDFGVKGDKQKYEYPKQKDKRNVVKLPAKKGRPNKSK